jgi:hypothetical protein
MERADSYCWEITGCEHRKREKCAAYRVRRNCWEVAGTPISGDDQLTCENCPVILSRIARAIAEAMAANARPIGRPRRF